LLSVRDYGDSSIVIYVFSQEQNRKVLAIPIDSSYASQLNDIWNTYTPTTEITAVPKPVIAAATKNRSELEFVASFVNHLSWTAL
jgi:hypothetical protein